MSAAVFVVIAYAAVGGLVAVGFVARGADAVLPGAATFTRGARLMLLPGAFLLWPYVLARWLAAGGRR